MAHVAPKVSIGLPVFNGDQFLEEALDSILAQTFTDFELIISDNASTDRTAEICRAYAARDPRIRYQCNASNIGGANNGNLTFRLSRGQYFRWAAHDDVCAPHLIEKCVQDLDNDPALVLSYSQTIDIDEKGDVITKKKIRLGEADTPHQRLLEISNRNHYCEVGYGLIRSDVLKATRLVQSYTDSDRTLLCELCLHGKFHQVQEPLFYKRHHPKNAYWDWRTRMAWFDEKLVGKIVLPYWMQLMDFFVTVHRVPLSIGEKARCYLVVLGPIIFRSWRELLSDVKFALTLTFHSVAWRKKRYAETMNW